MIRVIFLSNQSIGYFYSEQYLIYFVNFAPHKYRKLDYSVKIIGCFGRSLNIKIIIFHDEKKYHAFNHRFCDVGVG